MTSGRVLITGAYGLIGHETVLALQSAGFDVVPTDILPEPPSDAAFEAVPLAITGVAPILRVLEEHGIESIVHTAGVSGPMLGKSQPHSVLSTNVGGALDLYEAARLASVQRIVLTSSAGAYGDTGDVLVDEGVPLAATSAYGVSKLCSVRIAQAYAHHNVESVILRPSWVYGHRRRTDCVIKTMITDALANAPTHFPYGAGFSRQFVHVSDVAASVNKALTTTKGVQRAYNISEGIRYPLDDVARLVRERLPTAQIDMADGPDPDDILCGQLDISAARANLDWEPKIDLPTGIDKMILALSGRQ